MHTPAPHRYWFRSTRLTLSVLPVLLAGCGYAPLYQALPGGAPVSIGQVQVQNPKKLPGERRVAQAVAERLKLDFPRTDGSLDIATVSIREQTSTLAVERTATVQRAAITLTATLWIKTETGEERLKTELSATAPYNVENTPFSTESGKTFARQSAARNLAEEISRRLTLFYRQQVGATSTTTAP
jgi:hypothetical protein